MENNSQHGAGNASAIRQTTFNPELHPANEDKKMAEDFSMVANSPETAPDYEGTPNLGLLATNSASPSQEGDVSAGVRVDANPPAQEGGNGNVTPLGQQAVYSTSPSQGIITACLHGDSPADTGTSIGGNPLLGQQASNTASLSAESIAEGLSTRVCVPVSTPIFKERATQTEKIDVYRWYFEHGYNNRKFIMGKLNLSPYEFDKLYRLLCNHDEKFYAVDFGEEEIRKPKITDAGFNISKHNLELLGADSVFVKGKEVVFKFDKNSGNIIASVYNEVS